MPDSPCRFLGLFLANLIPNRAGSFASGLAGALAIATTAMYAGTFQGAFYHLLNVFFHLAHPP